MLVDTSGLICLFDRDDAQHEDARVFFRSAPKRLISNYVLAEFVPLGQVRGYKRADILTFTLRLARNPLVEVTWVDAEFHREAMNLLQSRLNKTYSVCDAISFLMMEQHNITEALTTDHHFEQAGFHKLLR